MTVDRSSSYCNHFMMQCLAQTVFVVKKQHGEKCIVRSAQFVPNFDKHFAEIAQNFGPC